MFMAQTFKGYVQDKRGAGLLRPIFAPLPLFMIQPILKRIVTRIAQDRPELFNRIGPHKDKAFTIDATNLPFVMVLRPNPDRPTLKAYRRHATPVTEARIAGTFLTLLDMVDGRLDGDALFFTRELTVEGDTEAVVCLRNAIDDVDGSIAEDTAAIFGPVGQKALTVLRSLREKDNDA